MSYGLYGHMHIMVIMDTMNIIERKKEIINNINMVAVIDIMNIMKVRDLLKKLFIL